MSGIIWNFESWMIPFSLVLILGSQIILPNQLGNPPLSTFNSFEDDEVGEDLAGKDDSNSGMMEAYDRFFQRALWMQVKVYLVTSYNP